MPFFSDVLRSAPVFGHAQLPPRVRRPTRQASSQWGDSKERYISSLGRGSGRSLWKGQRANMGRRNCLQFLASTPSNGGGTPARCWRPASFPICNDSVNESLPYISKESGADRMCNLGDARFSVRTQPKLPGNHRIAVNAKEFRSSSSSSESFETISDVVTVVSLKQRRNTDGSSRFDKFSTIHATKAANGSLRCRPSRPRPSDPLKCKFSSGYRPHPAGRP